MPPSISYEEFRSEWLADVIDKPTAVARGNYFAQKLISGWLDLDEFSADVTFCDGAGDGGIDVAYLELGDGPDDGDRWYLVQSKYGTALQGPDTIVTEGIKVLDTLDGRRQRLSSLSAEILDKITNFRNQLSDRDRLILVYATIDPLSPDENNAKERVRTLGRATFGEYFDVETISLRTIYDALQETLDEMVVVSLKANLSESSDDLMVGTATLADLYEFLKSYRSTTQDLDQLYDKNVRRFLGGRRRVNKQIAKTIEEEPEKFGLFNNGITIVAADFRASDGSIELGNPYIVNGCQTTRSIWDVFDRKLNSGGTGENPVLTAWKERASKGVVVTKIVRVGEDGEELLSSITRYTNSQNAVSDKDFLTLHDNFRSWKAEMDSRYEIYLETQRGGWDSYNAMKKRRPLAFPLHKQTNAFDLIKVYGAGWLGEAGTAFGRNAAFLPNGSVYKKIMGIDGEPTSFGVDDFYAAYLLQQSANERKFGRRADRDSRKQTRYLYYFIVIYLLRDILRRIAGNEPSPHEITDALLKIYSMPSEVQDLLLDTAIDALDEYMNPSMEESFGKEPALKNELNMDLNRFLKWEPLGRPDKTPVLHGLLGQYQRTLGRTNGSLPSPRQVLTNVISSDVE